MNFQEIVVYIALIIMIIALIVVFMMLYYSSDKNQFPPIIGECPDFFVVNADGNCQNYAGIGNATYQRPAQKTSLTNDEACSLKNELLANRQTWDGITNNPKICK
jgi:hypothetical protein